METDFPPVRKVVSRAPHKTVRVLNLSAQLDAPVECESSLERDFVLRAALCPSVVAIRHQPLQLTLNSGRRYTPDFLVRHSDGSSTVVEVKPLHKIASYRDVFIQAAQQLASQGIRFAVATDSSLRRNDVHRRAALILRYAKDQVDAPGKDRVRALLTGRGRGMPLGELAATCAVPQELVVHMLALRVITTGPTLHIAPATIVHLTPETEGQHAIHVEHWTDSSLWPATARTEAPAQRPRSAVGGPTHWPSDGHPSQRADSADLLETI